MANAVFSTDRRGITAARENFPEGSGIRSLVQCVLDRVASLLGRWTSRKRGREEISWDQDVDATPDQGWVDISWDQDVDATPQRPPETDWLNSVDRHQLLDALTETELIFTAEDFEDVAATTSALAFQILSDAIDRYRRPDGYEGDLVDAAWQLEQIGRDAWPALTGLASSGAPECEFFLGAMVRIEDVSLHDRRSVLLTVAKNPDANVRSRLLELVDELPVDLRREVVGVLAADESPYDAVTERARDALTVLECQGR